VLDALHAHGALFVQDLAAITQLLPGYLEEALRELAGSGLVTSDAFAAIRSLVGSTHYPRRDLRRRGQPRTNKALAPSGGRWSRFPAYMGPSVPRDVQVESWCRQLLRRYGVVFRDILAREAAAPPWRELAATLRRMELRGQVRGGRFVSDVAGEQFADEAAVGRLRDIRDLRDEDARDWIVISAADPLNLTGIVTQGQRIAANHKNALILKGGRCVAAKQAGQIEFFAEFDAITTAEMRRALQTGRRQSDAHIRQSWLDEKHEPPIARVRPPTMPSQSMRRV
jgi:ATP-dependent Lhr-like helicase